MEKSELYTVVRNLLLTEMAKTGEKYVPVAISNRHVHLCRADVEKLFGNGYQLHLSKKISQPGQFACEEKIKLIGPKGSISDVRVLGPERKQTQVEILYTDSFKLGIKPVVHMSGDLIGTPGIQLCGPSGVVELDSGVIISARHLHMSCEEAGAYGFKEGDAIKIRKQGVRVSVYDNVIVRTGKEHSLEVHLDTDEGNAAAITCGEILEVI